MAPKMRNANLVIGTVVVAAKRHSLSQLPSVVGGGKPGLPFHGHRIVGVVRGRRHVGRHADAGHIGASHSFCCRRGLAGGERGRSNGAGWQRKDLQTVAATVNHGDVQGDCLRCGAHSIVEGVLRAPQQAIERRPQRGVCRYIGALGGIDKGAERGV